MRRVDGPARCAEGQLDNRGLRVDWQNSDPDRRPDEQHAVDAARRATMRGGQPAAEVAR